LIYTTHIVLTSFENFNPRVIKTIENITPEMIVNIDLNSNFGAPGSKSLTINEAKVNFDKSNQYLENSLY